MPTRVGFPPFKRWSEPEMKTLDSSDFLMASGSIHKEVKAVLDERVRKAVNIIVSDRTAVGWEELHPTS